MMMTLSEKVAEIGRREQNSLTTGPADDRELIDLINDNIALNLDGELSAFAAARFKEIGEDAYWREYSDVLIDGNSSYDFSDLSWDEGISLRQQRFWGLLLAEGLRLGRGSQKERCINHLKVPGHRGVVLNMFVFRLVPGLAELLRDDLVALADTHNWMPSEAHALAVVLWDLKAENAKQIIFRLAQRVDDESRRWSKDIRLVVERSPEAHPLLIPVGGVAANRVGQRSSVSSVGRRRATLLDIIYDSLAPSKPGLPSGSWQRVAGKIAGMLVFLVVTTIALRIPNLPLIAVGLLAAIIIEVVLRLIFNDTVEEPD